MQPRQAKIILGSLGSLLLLLGFIQMMMWRQHSGLANLAASDPQTITLQALIADGPGENRHVRITQFAFGGGYVEVDESNNYPKYWIPVYPASEEDAQNHLEDPGGPFHVLIVTEKKPQNGHRLDRHFAKAKPIEGVVTYEDGVRSWTTLGRQLLKMYPGTDLDHCLVIEEEPRIWSASSLQWLYRVGVGMLAGGAALILVLSALIIRDHRVAAAAQTWG